MNTILFLIGDVFMMLYAICALVSAIILLIDIFNSQEYKDKQKTKKLEKSMELIRIDNNSTPLFKKDINQEKYNNKALENFQIYEFHQINNMLINKYID